MRMTRRRPCHPLVFRRGALRMFRTRAVSFMSRRFSPGFLFRPSRGDQPPPSEGVLLPTMLDDFDDSVLGDPITYARREQFPGFESPISLPVYAWFCLSAGAVVTSDCVGFGGLLSSGGGGVLCHRSTHGSGGRPVFGNGPAGLSVPVLGVWWTAVFRWESSIWLTASSPMAPGVRRSTGVGLTPRLFTNGFGWTN